MSIKNFDERQQIERGKAFQWAFLTAILLLGICYFVDECLEIYNFSTYLIFMSTFWISFSVFATKAILNDAFNGVNEKSSWIFCIVFGIMGLLTLTVTLIAIFETSLTDRDIGSIIGSLAMLEMSIIFFIKRKKDNSADSEEE